MGKRVVLGLQNDGSYGLRVSASGVDADIGSGQGGDFTFNSAWTDISKILMLGIATNSTSGATPSFAFRLSFVNQGYIPFTEIRLLQTNVVWDDWFTASYPYGSFSQVTATTLTSGGFSSYIPLTALYIIHKIAVPSG